MDGGNPEVIKEPSHEKQCLHPFSPNQRQDGSLGGGVERGSLRAGRVLLNRDLTVKTRTPPRGGGGWRPLPAGAKGQAPSKHDGQVSGTPLCLLPAAPRLVRGQFRSRVRPSEAGGE